MFLSKISKSPYYQIIFEVNGKRTKKSTKKKSFEEAEQVLKNFQEEVSNKNENSHSNPQAILLSKFCEEYIEHVTMCNAKSYVDSIKLVTSKLLEFTGDIPLNHITKKDAEKFITVTYSRSKSSGGLYYRTLKAAFTKAVSWEYISENPLKKINAPKQTKSYPAFITKEELDLILTNTKEKVLRDLFTTAFYTGMRRGELINMKWNWVNFEQGIITVKCDYQFNTKSKKERIIPISKALKPILSNIFPKVINIRRDDYVFTITPGIKLNGDFVCKKFKKAIRAAKLNEGVHFHTLRHSFASNLVQKGTPLYVVKELLGHEDLATTQIYSHLQHDNLKSAVNLL
jgi:site-specific recombinase XerD